MTVLIVIHSTRKGSSLTPKQYKQPRTKDETRPFQPFNFLHIFLSGLEETRTQELDNSTSTPRFGNISIIGSNSFCVIDVK